MSWLAWIRLSLGRLANAVTECMMERNLSLFYKLSLNSVPMGSLHRVQHGIALAQHSKSITLQFISLNTTIDLFFRSIQFSSL
jgi:hypothetical protein